MDLAETTIGRCDNFDFCALAAGRRDVEVPLGLGFFCPECAHPLQPPRNVRSVGVAGPLLMLCAAALLLLAAGVAAGLGMARMMARPAAMVPVTPVKLVAPPATPQTPPAPDFLLRIGAPPGLAGQIGAQLAAGYLTQSGDFSVLLEPGAQPGEMLARGERFGRSERIRIVSPAPAVCAAGCLALAWQPVGPDAAAGGLVLAHGAAVVVVNPANRVASLSVDQLARVLDGRVKTWQALGGPARPVHVVVPQAWVAQGFRALVPGVGSLDEDAAIVENVAQAVRADPDAVGLTWFGSAANAKVLEVGQAAGAAVLPDATHIADGSYPLTERLVWRDAPGDAGFAGGFAAYAAGPAARAILAKAGLVSPAALPVPGRESQPYAALVADASRFFPNVRFLPGQAVLDAHSEQIVTRACAFMDMHHIAPARLLLVSGDGGLLSAAAKAFAGCKIAPGHLAVVTDMPAEKDRVDQRRVELFVLKAP